MEMLVRQSWLDVKVRCFMFFDIPARIAVPCPEGFYPAFQLFSFLKTKFILRFQLNLGSQKEKRRLRKISLV